MTASIEISKLAEQLVALNLPDHGHQSFAVVLPLVDGRADVVREFLAEEPPFDPAQLGLEHHHVFVTDTEAIFVFETAAGLNDLEQLLAEPEFWDVVAAWERCAASEPRVAAAAYEWPKGRRTPGS